MKCPQCKHNMTCGCATCQTRQATEKPDIMKGDNVSCGNCGLTKHAMEWLDLEWDLMKKQSSEGVNNYEQKQ